MDDLMGKMDEVSSAATTPMTDLPPRDEPKIP
jgi:hypothetical protein